MSTQKLIRAFSRTHIPSNQHQVTASNIVQALSYSSIEPLKHSPLIRSTLNSHVVQLVLSNPRLSLRSCLQFFNFLRENPAHKPDLAAHLTFICRLYDVRKFTDIQFVLNCIANDVNLRTPVSNIVSFVEHCTVDPIFVQKLCDILFRVYADNGMFEEAIGVFDYMEKSEIEIHERCCMVLLLALKSCDKMDTCFSFFQRMVGAKLEITAKSVAIVVSGLCVRGEVERAKGLMEVMVTKGIEPDVLAYNSLINGYCIRDVALKLFSEMKQRGMIPDLFIYTIIILGLSKHGRPDGALRLYDEMIEAGITPDEYLYIKCSNKGGENKSSHFCFWRDTPRKGGLLNQKLWVLGIGTWFRVHRVRKGLMGIMYRLYERESGLSHSRSSVWPKQELLLL
ncbi:hypothetical protein Q3G72_033000 [Acer saccharum]|nr:hypothetical protein Q3G72_033000 [Acer saccharum]